MIDLSRERVASATFVIFEFDETIRELKKNGCKFVCGKWGIEMEMKLGIL